MSSWNRDIIASLDAFGLRYGTDISGVGAGMGWNDKAIAKLDAVATAAGLSIGSIGDGMGWNDRFAAKLQAIADGINPVAPSWTELDAANGTITLNGGTASYAGGKWTLTFPGGAAQARTGEGLHIRMAARYPDGTRVRGDNFSAVAMLIEPDGTTPGTSSDAMLLAGVVGSAKNLATDSNQVGVGLHYAAATIAGVADRWGSSHALEAAPTGNARGAIGNIGSRHQDSLDTGSINCMDLDVNGVRLPYNEGVGNSNVKVVDGEWDFYVALFRTNTTAGTVTWEGTIKFLASRLPVGAP